VSGPDECGSSSIEVFLEGKMKRLRRIWQTAKSMMKYLRMKDTGIPLDFIRVLRLNPGDVLVVRAGVVLSGNQMEVTKASLERIIGGRNQVLMLDGQWGVEVIRCTDEPKVVEE
jgi:hypothetical protein